MCMNKKYKIIYADPPWQYNDNKSWGNAEKYYNTMHIDDICKLPIQNICDDDCVLFLWATYPTLPDAFKVIDAWGFTYKTLGFQWIKRNKTGMGYFMGLGHWTRSNSEPCLIATKGKIKPIRRDVRQLLFYPIREHSAKPPIIRRKIVELMGDLPRIELFARTKTPGWDCWGNEVTNDLELPSN